MCDGVLAVLCRATFWRLVCSALVVRCGGAPMRTSMRSRWSPTSFTRSAPRLPPHPATAARAATAPTAPPSFHCASLSLQLCVELSVPGGVRLEWSEGFWPKVVWLVQVLEWLFDACFWDRVLEAVPASAFVLLVVSGLLGHVVGDFW